MRKLHYDKQDHIAIITMEGDNDLNIGMTGGELNQRLAEYAEDDELRCCIVTGAGSRAFSAGGDLRNTYGGGMGGGALSVWNSQPLNIVSGLEIWKPIIAAINGYAVGAGCMLALACDIRIASENASFSIPEIKLGFPSGMGAPQRLPRLIPFGAALEMLLTGDRIDAQQALQWGLVNRVVPQAELMDTALDLASRIAASHHERWDGTGYPCKLAGKDIPIEGRITAVADVFDALLSRRRYKDAWSYEDAVREIKAHAGTSFDPSVVTAFLASRAETKEIYARYHRAAKKIGVNRAA